MPLEAKEPQMKEGQDAAPQGQQGVITSLFAAPPIQAALFTRDNIHRYQLLKQQARDADQSDFNWNTAEPLERLQRQADIIEKEAAKVKEEQKNDDVDMEDEGEVNRKEKTDAIAAQVEKAPQLLPVPDWDILLTMEPPRVDWIEEDGSYTCFGDRWPVEDKLAGLREIGMRQFYPDDCQDRRPAMVTLLRTLLKSYLGLVDVLLEPPQEYLASEQIPNTDQVIQTWRFASQDKAKDINDLSINFMHLLNETRPLQAKEELKNLLRKQLNRRREETELIKMQCKAMRTELAKMRES